MRLFSRFRSFLPRESGATLIEALVALVILSTIIITFLSGLVITSKAAFTTDEMTTAESLAQTQMEWAQSANYTDNATQYSPASIPVGKDYVNYSVNITAAPLNAPDDGIQKITVIVKRFGEQVYRLESYKVDR